MKTKPKAVATAKPKMTLAEKINNHMPAGLVVEQSGEGRVRIAVDSTARQDRFDSVGGCKNEFANLMVLNQVLEAMPQTGDIATAAVRAAGAFYMMEAFAPKDGVEAMIASQAVALHMLTIEAARRAQMLNQPIEATSRLRRDTANLARSMTEMCEALDRRRGKGHQVVRVERVVVHEGGQAVVGNVQTGGLPRAVERGAEPLALMEDEPAAVGSGEGYDG